MRGYWAKARKYFQQYRSAKADQISEVKTFMADDPLHLSEDKLHHTEDVSEGRKHLLCGVKLFLNAVPYNRTDVRFLRRSATKFRCAAKEVLSADQILQRLSD